MHNSKGSKFERDLFKMLYDRGWACIRAAGSGSNGISPDVVAIKDKQIVTFECKNREGTSLYIDREQYYGLVDWVKRTDSLVFVAWKWNGEKPYFALLGEFHATEEGFAISKERIKALNMRLDDVLALVGMAPGFGQPMQIISVTTAHTEPDRTYGSYTLGPFRAPRPN